MGVAGLGKSATVNALRDTRDSLQAYSGAQQDFDAYIAKLTPDQRLKLNQIIDGAGDGILSQIKTSIKIKFKFSEYSRLSKAVQKSKKASSQTGTISSR